MSSWCWEDEFVKEDRGDKDDDDEEEERGLCVVAVCRRCHDVKSDKDGTPMDVFSPPPVQREDNQRPLLL